MVTEACNPSTQEDEAGSGAFKASLGYVSKNLSQKQKQRQKLELINKPYLPASVSNKVP
jgi:hypothetical protein